MENNVIYDAIQSVAEQTEYNGGGIDSLLNGRIVKSVQRGSNVGITVSNNKSVATISKVNTAKSVLIHSQIQNSNATNAALTLDSSGTQILCVMANGSLTGQTFVWQVIEFY